MGSPFEEILDHDVLLELAGERYFERGEGYYRGGHVRTLVEHEGLLTARILGTHEYRVRFSCKDGELAYSCDCPLGMDGEFCKHCVAVGLAWLRGETERDLPGQGTALVDMNDVRAYLEGREKEVLVRILMEGAMEDERLRERLLLRTARDDADGPNLAVFRRAIDDAFDTGRFSDYYPGPEEMRGTESVVESLADLLEEGYAAEVIELSEHALASAENAMEYDSYGNVEVALQDLRELHRAACERAKPDPKALARRLFEWELRGPYGTFSDAVDAYAGVLGEEGLAEYRRLAEEEWARLPELGPGTDRRKRYGGRFRLRRIMETLARRGGDTEELVAVKSKDLSDPRAYLEISEIYKKAGDHDKALEWAERGMRAFPERPDPHLRDFLAKEYQNRRRHKEAMELIWEAFAEHPHLENYRKLRAHAIRAGAWSRWRERALSFLREDIAAKKNDSARSRWLSPPGSVLVEIYLWENNVEDAWREAQEEGGCSEGLWLRLAAAREEDHPEDAVPIYRRRAERLIEQTNKGAYEEAREFLLKVRELMGRMDREPEFGAYLQEIRDNHRRKRNLMKLLDEME